MARFAEELRKKVKEPAIRPMEVDNLTDQTHNHEHKDNDELVGACPGNLDIIKGKLHLIQLSLQLEFQDF